MMWEVICVAAGIFFGIPIIKCFVNTMTGLNRINMMKKLGIPATRLLDLQHAKEDYVKSILFNFLSCIVMLYCIYVSISFLHSAILAFGSILICGNTIISTIQILLVRRHGKYAYLTKDYFVTINGECSKTKCRFSVEREVRDEGDMYLNVYKGDRERPILYRYKIIENQDKVIQVINDYYQRK